MQQHLSSSNYHVPEKVKRETVQKISDLALNHTVITHLTLFEGLKEPHQETKMKKKKKHLIPLSIFVDCEWQTMK